MIPVRTILLLLSPLLLLLLEPSRVRITPEDVVPLLAPAHHPVSPQMVSGTTCQGLSDMGNGHATAVLVPCAINTGSTR